MLPDGGPGGQEKCDQRKGENRKGNKAKKRKQGRTEEKRRKKKNAPTESGGVPWHTMCPVIFAPTVPAPGRFSFPFLNAARGALALSWISRFPLHHSARGALPLLRVSVFRFFIPCAAYFHFLSQAFPFFALLSSAPPAQAGSLPDAYRHFTVPMRMHNSIPMCRYPHFSIPICVDPCFGIPICHLLFRRRSGKII